MKRSVFHYDIDEVAPYIDWSYFLHAWGIGNAEPHNSGAKEIIGEAKDMLHSFNGKYQTHALFALCDAHSHEDDIIIEGRRMPLLRQQHSIAGKPNLCLSDFVSPQSDRIALFATTVDNGLGHEYQNDDYRNIIARILADRLAEATATLMHRTVRTEMSYWGYAPDERLTIEELNSEKYQGIRPAVGYPSLPDQSIIFIIDTILGVKEIGIDLTPNGAMFPHASVCGIMLSHPLARYFAVGEISEEQLHDYAIRRELPADELKKFLSRNIQGAV